MPSDGSDSDLTQTDSTLNAQRRRFLAGIGATGVAGMFAGCLGGDDDDGADDDTGDDNGDDGNGGNGNGVDPEPAFFEVSAGDVTATRGEVAELTATVENTGEEEGTQDVTVHFDEEEIASESVTLEGSESETVSLTDVDAGELDPDDYEYTVRTDDDETTITVTVEPIDPESLLNIDSEHLFYSGSESLLATVENPFALPAEAGELTLSVPDGWEVTDSSGTSFETLGPDVVQDVEWELVVPDDAESENELTVEESYTIDGEAGTFTTTVSAAVPQPLAAPLGLNLGGHPDGDDEQVVIDGLEFANELPNAITVFGNMGAATDDFDNIEGTEYDALYLTEHYGEGGAEFGYEIFLENGTYEVTAHFAETFHDTEEDGRVINILANDELVVEEYSPFAEGGGFAAASQASFAVEVTDDFLTLLFEPVADWPAVKGLEIHSAGDE